MIAAAALEMPNCGVHLKDNRTKRVAFGNAAVYKAFQELKSGRFEEKEIAGHIQKAIDNLKEDPFVGKAIHRRLWPAEYVRKYAITNLRKYNMPDGWRLIYTLQGNQVEIISIILEWFPHKDYEKRFKY